MNRTRRISRRSVEVGMKARPWVRMIVAVTGIMVGSVLLAVFKGDGDAASLERRGLQTDCSDFIPVDDDGNFRTKGVELCDGSKNYIYLCIALMIYSFWSLAIIVDEDFVPTLDFIVLELGVSEDVAGATFMAAGGSAPEFFTNLISTLELTGTGFGTIVGSAIFNILFVISMSAFFSRPREEVVRRRKILEETGKLVTDPWPREPLPLTWWPLFRDAMSYVLGLSVLALFYFCNSDGLVPGGFCNGSDGGFILWYESFILFMMYVGYCFLMVIQEPVKSFIETYLPFIVPHKQKRFTELAPKIEAKLGESERSAGSQGATHKEVLGNNAKLKDEFGHQASEQKLRTESFDGEGGDDPESPPVRTETPKMVRMGSTLSRRPVWADDNMRRSNERLRRSSSVSMVGDMLARGQHERDKENGDAMDLDDDEVDVIVPRMRPTSFLGDPERKNEVLYRIMNAIGFLLVLPILACNKIVFFTFDDLVNIKDPIKKRMAVTWAFMMSLVAIAAFTYIMVYSAETFAATVGIPDTILGFTILAAGTSTPDLLSSVFVARLGYGDMAVSSSIGSNIFDILVGLPIPWLISIAARSEPLPVRTDAVGFSLGVIIAMVVSLVVIIIYSDWKLTDQAAWAMLVLYFIFLLAVILAEVL